MIADVQQLVRTLIDIIFLRKGPDSVPHSTLLATLIAGLWLATSYAVHEIFKQDETGSFARSLVISAIAIAVYAAILVFAKRTGRILQTFTAILGCGALISLTAAFGILFLTGLVGELWAALFALLILVWSVPVEGHIIARAIDRHLTEGILIAAAVFALQLYIDFSVMTPR
jgi:hypothetical protein